VWHIHVDTEPISAAAFARRFGVGERAALRWFHEARAALVFAAVTTTTAVAQVLGRASRANAEWVALAVDDHGLTLSRAADAPPALDAPSPAAALWLGRLRAWIADVFRGVTRRWLDRYLAEFAHRYRRQPPFSMHRAPR
jgi:hypothetical protein